VRLRVVVLALASCLALGTGCFRTHYANFCDANPNRGISYEPVEATGWQSFFIYGWAPGEKRIDAAEECGGTEKIDSIRTRRTFLEGLVAAFAGYCINIYSPWDGAVYCTEVAGSG